MHAGNPDTRQARELPPVIRRTDLLCQPDDADQWYPDTQNGRSATHATNTCRLCPAHTACAVWAIDTRQQHGVWGALTETDRRRIIAEHPDWNDLPADARAYLVDQTRRYGHRNPS